MVSVHNILISSKDVLNSVPRNHLFHQFDKKSAFLLLSCVAWILEVPQCTGDVTPGNFLEIG